MEDFTILSDENYNASNNHHQQQQHHHKDHMLAAGSTQANHFTYDISIKPEASVLKNDYSMFTNYIQQSTLLERAVDPALDSSCLSSLCDLKFPSDSSSLNATLNSDSHYKSLSIGNIEANNTLSKIATGTVPNIGTTSVAASDINPEAASSFSSILFPRDNALNAIGNESKTIQHSIHTSQNYLSIKPTNSDAKLNNAHFLQTTSAVASSSCDIGVMRFTQSNSNTCNSNNNSSNNTNSSCNHDKQILQTVVQTNYLNNSGRSPRNDLNINDTSISLIESSDNNNKTNSGNNQQSNVNNNGQSFLALRNTTEHQITTTSSVTKSAALHKGDDVATSSSSSILTLSSVSKNHNNNNNNNNSEVSANIDSLSQNLSIQSSDCDSLSSDELIDLENNERLGYQDTTSSHSQQSAGGGGGGGGGLGGGGGGPGSNSGGGGGGGTNANTSSVVLLNGGVGQANNSGGYMSLIPPTVGITSSSGTHLGSVTGGTSASASGATGEGGSAGGGGIDFKHLFEELCPVCGDKVSGYHYGLLTCESCKGFFKRTVQNKKVYTCVAERSCHIDKTQRKRCPYCRFQKCLEVGMKLEAVRADRMRGGRNKFGPMYKRDRARKLQVMRQRQLALQALRSSIGSTDMKSTPLSPGYQAYPNMNIKQEIQIPQVSSLTQSPDSSPSPIAIALGQVNASTSVITNPLNGTTGSSSNNTSTTSDSINRSGASSCHETGSGSIQNTADSKLCFDSGTHPSSTADSVIEPLRVSPMIRDFVQSIDDREWQTQLFALLQKQTYNQVEVDLFELMCKVLDQNLFSQVDWARNTVFFKDLKVDDQMKLLQHSWSDMLVLDHLHQRIHNGLPDETQLNNGQVFNLLGLGLLGVPQLGDYFNELQNKLQDLKFDMGDYVCMKFLILLNPDVRGIINKKTVLEGHENVQAALLDYTLTCYPSVTDKFRRLLNILPDIHAMAARGEEHLYSKHCAGSAPTQTLLMEMLHAKRKV